MRPTTIVLAALFACATLLAPVRADVNPAAARSTAPTPPVAAKKPHVVPSPHGKRTDEYYWLRDDTRSNPEVLGYLKAENAYADAMLAHLAPLQETLYQEIVGRIAQDDSSVPYRKNGWWYYSRYAPGQDHPVHARRRGSPTAPEEILLDGPALAKGHGFFEIGSFDVSRDGRMLAWTEDTVGRRQYTLRFRNLETGATLPDRIENVEPEIAWAGDHQTLLYVEKDPVTLLGDKIRKHKLGTDPKSDPLVYAQDDPSFYTSVGRTRDDRYVYVYAGSTVSSEMRVADANDPELAFRVFLPRERDHEYHAEHLDGRWIIRTNWQAPNFRLMKAKVGEEGDRGKWREILPHRKDAYVEGFDAFRDFLAVDERSSGLRRVRLIPWADGTSRYIDSDDPASAFRLAHNPEVDTSLVRYEYESMTTPLSTYEYEVRSGQRTLLKREPVLGGFDPTKYASEFTWATARDGTRVPVSIVYRKGFRRDGKAPLLQYAYGAYGASTDPSFSTSALSLLDRGFVYAIAHVRGGQELGRDWYERGRLLDKQNTFNDFVDVTRFLVKEGYADPKRVFAMGLSAGGLLMGAVATQAPQDYRAVVAMVPFVDVVTTMLDESIPLVTNEFDEWGDPTQKAYYDYLLAYSPYDNVKRQDYPALMVTTGLWDSQVQYYEPAKWVARLRAHKTDGNPLLFRTTMQAGHGGKPGRFEQYRETAEIYAFLLDQAGLGR